MVNRVLHEFALVPDDKSAKFRVRTFDLVQYELSSVSSLLESPDGEVDGVRGVASPSSVLVSDCMIMSMVLRPLLQCTW